jgi:alkaline phosphatase D
MTLIVGHRGGRNLWPENSVTGFRNVLGAGVEAVEFDVHLSDAGELLVVHDATLERTTEGSGPVRQLTPEQRRSVRLKDSTDTIPTLVEVLEVLEAGDCQLHVEIKSSEAGVPYPGLPERVAATLTRLMPPVSKRPIISRRHFLGSGLAAAAIWPGLGSVRAASFDTDPFALGVASGCPTADGVILWTRLVFPAEPAPLANPFEPLPETTVPPMDVAWEMADDEAFSRPVQSGIYQASQEWGHSVHVAVTGLQPDRWYYYRFRCGNAESRVGRTRTAPAIDADNASFSFAFASCQQYEQGFYSAYRDMAGRDLDLVAHLGDYIYERSYGTRLVRRHGTGWPLLLSDYRDRHALYKSDPDLQAAHANFPWLAVWDDHEVINNYANDTAPDSAGGASFLRQRAAAYQAWYEHMPVPPRNSLDFSSFRIHGRHGFGRLLDVAMLDTRQYRSAPLVEGVDDDTAERTILGVEQEAWFDQTLKSSQSQWTVIAQYTLLSERDTEAGEATGYGLDGWDGYRSARSRLLDSVRTSGTANPLVIGGDLHAFYAADVKDDFSNPDSPTLATEFVTGSISSDGPSDASIEAVEILGSESLIYVSVDGIDELLTVKTPGAHWHDGKPATLNLPFEHLHLFDARTGVRLAGSGE